MIELNIKDNSTYKRRKIPLLIFLLIILGGIFLFILFLFNYHFDSIDDFVSEDVNLYSHWQTKKVFQQNNDKLNKLIEYSTDNPNFPDNFKEKLLNSSEFAIIQLENHWFFIFKPINFDNFSKLFQYNEYAIEAIQNENVIKSIINENLPISQNPTYRTKKHFDFSKANIFIKDLAYLPYFSQNTQILADNSFWKIQIKNDFIKLNSKQTTNTENCKNNIQIPDFLDYQYYINNLSTNNDNISNIPYLANTNTCVDLLIKDEDKWLILAPKSVKNIIKDSIIDYFAYKYPNKQVKTLPDGSISTQIIADKTIFNWQQDDDNDFSIKYESEKIYLKEYDQDFIQLSNIDQKLSFPEQNSYNNCDLINLSKSGSDNIIYLNNPSQYIFNNILINQYFDDISICIH